MDRPWCACVRGYGDHLARLCRGRDASSLDTRRSPSNRYRWNSESIRLVLCYGAFGFGYIIPATFFR